MKPQINNVSFFPFSMPIEDYLFSFLSVFLINTIIIIVAFYFIEKKIDIKKIFFSDLCATTFSVISHMVGMISLTIISISVDNEYYEGTDLIKQIKSGIYLATNHSPLDSIWSILFTLFGFLISMVIIFFSNYFISFIQTDFTKKQKAITSLVLSLATAPYIFFFPNQWHCGMISCK